MTSEILTRCELHDLVWQTPVRVLAERFNISDVALRKRCARSDIPVPPAGYWARVRAGQKVARPSLPPRGAGMSETIDFSRKGNTYWNPRPLTDSELLAPDPEPPVFDESIESVRKRYAERIGKVRVDRDLACAHHRIRKLLDEDDVRRKAMAGKGYISLFDGPRFEGAFEQRRLRILSALMIACAREGAKPEIRGRRARDINVMVNEHTLHIGIDSDTALKHGRDDWRTDETPPKTPLKLIIRRSWDSKDARADWQDAADHKLEADIADIAVEIFVQAEADYRATQQYRHKWRIEAKARRIEEIRKAKEKAQRDELDRQEGLRKERTARLLVDADAFNQARHIREYVQSVRSLALERDPEIVDRWAQWALTVADEIDPVVTGRFLETGVSQDK